MDKEILLYPHEWFQIEGCFDELVEYFTVIRDSSNPTINFDERMQLFDMFGSIAQETFVIIARSLLRKYVERSPEK